MNKFEINIREGVRPITKLTGFDTETIQDFHVSYTPIRAGIFNIYLFGEIYDSRQFISAIEVLQAASQDDVVIIHLSSNGGSLDATDTFLSAMQDCQAKIVIKASGGVHSAGSVILMNADEFILSDNFNCLVHNGGVGPAGKFSDWVAAAEHTKSYMERVMRNTYSGFLTESELAAMIAGKDFWFDAEKFAARFESRQMYLEMKAEQVKKDVMTAMTAAAEKANKRKRPVKKKQPEEVTA